MSQNKIQAIVINELVIWVKENLEFKLTLKTLSVFSGYSEWHVFRLFKKYYNITPKGYILQQRMLLSSDLLRVDPRLRIVDICIMVGYQNVSSFSRAFKRYYTVTPAQFRMMWSYKQDTA